MSVERPTSWPKAEVVFDLPAEEYHKRQLGVVSNSCFGSLDRSPAHYLAWLEAPPNETEALVFGKAFHCAVLEPDVFASQYVVEPRFGDCRYAKAKAERDAWREANAGKIHMPAEDYESALGMAASLRKHPSIGRLLSKGKPEVTIRWTCPDTGAWCKARLDCIARAVLDLKSAEDASIDGFRKATIKHKYHRQAAHYLQGARVCGLDPLDFVFAMVEKTPPYCCAGHTLDEEGMRTARTKVHELKRRMVDALERDEWPGYSTDLTAHSVPPWAA